MYLTFLELIEQKLLDEEELGDVLMKLKSLAAPTSHHDDTSHSFLQRVVHQL